MSFPRYMEYKDSGINWLGEVPRHWEMKRFKQVFRERNERSAHGKETLLSVSAYTGVSPRSEIIDNGDHLSRAESLVGYKVCYPKDLVMNIMLAWNRGLGFTSHDGIVSPAYSVFQVIDGSDFAFLNYLVRSDEYLLYFKAFSAGVIDSRLRLYPDVFGRLSVALPSLAEQSAISIFLDREISKIDTLVGEQEKLITLLREKRQTVISQAVTKGIDPTVPMENSGIEWLGEVPEHWEISRIKHMTEFVTSGSRGWAQFYSDSGSIFIRIGNFSQRGTINLNLSDVQYVSPPPGSEGERTRVQQGDVLVSITANLGATAIIPPEIGEAYVNQHTALVRPQSQKINSRWLAYSIASEYIQKQIQMSTQGGTKEGLSLEDVRNITLLVPPRDEQDAIVKYLDRNEIVSDEAMTLLERQANLLLERRTALISAAVTGKIDVRGLVAEEVGV